MANIYKLKAAELSKGDNDGNHNDEIYALYYKCLQVSPGPTDGTEYRKAGSIRLVHAVRGGVQVFVSILNVQFSPEIVRFTSSFNQPWPAPQRYETESKNAVTK
ncbi:hypothetical protein C8R44DRAFT_740840 [Mycena epipterygia]|nr:hypothetical protein C8R44DRAFT_740840 [Mycena epipterygia]